MVSTLTTELDEDTPATQIVCIGECMLEVSGQGTSLNLGYAGDSLNVAIYIGRILGPDRVAYATRLGDDDLSGDMISYIKSEEVDTSLISRMPGRLPGLYLISTQKGERSFHYWRSEAPVREMLSESEPSLEQTLTQAGGLVLTGITMAVLSDNARIRLHESARKNKNNVSYIVNHRQQLWSAEQARHWCLAAAREYSILFVSEDDLTQLWPGGDGLDRIMECEPKEMVVTRGVRGCQVLQDGKVVVQSDAVESEVVDTTAAGDSFSAAYLAGKHKGLGIQECADLGARLASVVIGHRGAIIQKEAMERLMSP